MSADNFLIYLTLSVKRILYFFSLHSEIRTDDTGFNNNNNNKVTEQEKIRGQFGSKNRSRFLGSKIEAKRRKSLQQTWSPQTPPSSIIIQEEDKNIRFERRLDRHEEAYPEMPKIQPSRHFSVGGPVKDPDEGVLVVMSQRHMDGPRVDPHNAKPSTSVILGESP